VKKIMNEPNLEGWQDYWAIAVRRRWWLMRRFFSSELPAFGLAFSWPGRSREEARVLLGGQTVTSWNTTADGVTGQHASQSEQLMCAPSLNL
jgi:hypothetical protein